MKLEHAGWVLIDLEFSTDNWHRFGAELKLLVPKKDPYLTGVYLSLHLPRRVTPEVQFLFKLFEGEAVLDFYVAVPFIRFSFSILTRL